jgi:hypothetical protein
MVGVDSGRVGRLAWQDERARISRRKIIWIVRRIGMALFVQIRLP